MRDERIWLADETGTEVSEDQEQHLMEAGFGVARGQGASIDGGSPTVLLGSPEAVRGARREHPGALAIGLIDEDAAPPQDLDAVLRLPLRASVVNAVVEALRYRGEDRRWAPRVALGLDATIWTRSGPSRVTLSDLSVAGCGLISPKSMENGRRVVLWLPGARKGSLASRVSGRVVSCEEATGSDVGHVLGVEFTSTSSGCRRRLHALLDQHRGALLSPTEEACAESETGDAGARADVDAAFDGGTPERRRQRRQVYDRRIIAKRPQGPSVLMGRDLSVGGIKIEATSGLGLGTELQLAVHGRQGTTPLVVDAKVTRDDGPGGLVLEFENLDARRIDYLEKLVDELDADSDADSNADPDSDAAQLATPTDDIPF